MKYYQDFQPSGQSFEERIGPPETFDAAIGRIAVGFSFLEDCARNVSIVLAGTDLTTGHIITAELSFRQKVDLVGTLARHRLAALHSDEGTREDLVEELDEILFLCRRAEELRNTYLHSSYGQQLRAKMSAKAKHGLRVLVEPVSPSLLLDVADFIVHGATLLEGVPLLVGVADQTTSGSDHVTYTKAGAVVATFRFGETS